MFWLICFFDFYIFGGGVNQTRSVDGINSSQIQRFSNSSVIRIDKSNFYSRGIYSCMISIQSGNQWTNVSTIEPQYVSVTPLLFDFMTNSSIKEKDDYWVNCSYELSFDEYFDYLSLSKDNKQFYKFLNNSKGISESISQYELHFKLYTKLSKFRSSYN